MPRFRVIEKTNHVLAYLGDNLSDFPESFDIPLGTPPSERRLKVEALAENFGTRWFMLPNPVYGDWTRGLGPRPVLQLVLPSH